jgi:hypothetical protein
MTDKFVEALTEATRSKKIADAAGEYLRLRLLYETEHQPKEKAA